MVSAAAWLSADLSSEKATWTKSLAAARPSFLPGAGPSEVGARFRALDLDFPTTEAEVVVETRHISVPRIDELARENRLQREMLELGAAELEVCRSTITQQEIELKTQRDECQTLRQLLAHGACHPTR